VNHKNVVLFIFFGLLLIVMGVSAANVSQERAVHRSLGRDVLLREFRPLDHPDSLPWNGLDDRPRLRKTSTRTSLAAVPPAGIYLFLKTWGAFAAGGKGEVYGPRGAAIDSSGNIYMADSGNSRIQVFSKGSQEVRATL
jgi:hypothetical protein